MVAPKGQALARREVVPALHAQDVRAVDIPKLGQVSGTSWATSKPKHFCTSTPTCSTEQLGHGRPAPSAKDDEKDEVSGSRITEEKSGARLPAYAWECHLAGSAMGLPIRWAPWTSVA